jgi:hypothetical protein
MTLSEWYQWDPEEFELFFQLESVRVFRRHTHVLLAAFITAAMLSAVHGLSRYGKLTIITPWTHPSTISILLDLSVSFALHDAPASLPWSGIRLPVVSSS